MNQAESSKPLAGLRIASFESRHSSNMAKLLEKRGAIPMQAPSLQEVPYEENLDAIAFADVLLPGQCQCLIVMTGVGTKILIEAMASKWPKEDILEALGKIPIISRGPKPVATLKTYGLKPTLVAPAPNTWQDVIELLDSQWPIQGKTIHVQEYGARNQDFLDALGERDATIQPIPIYGWQLPTDTVPLQKAIESVIAGEVDITTFTSSHQISNVMHVAREMGQEDAMREAMQKVVIAAIGPVTQAAIRRQGLEPEIIPEKHKMGHLVKAIAESGPECVKNKKLSRP